MSLVLDITPNFIDGPWSPTILINCQYVNDGRLSVYEFYKTIDDKVFEMCNWCNLHFGQQKRNFSNLDFGTWCYKKDPTVTFAVKFFFKNNKDASLFKLRWQ
jgi:hypothetical protein